MVDQWSRSSPILACGMSLRGTDVAAAVGRAIGGGAAPRSITVDHGTEFISRALEDWAWRRGVRLGFTRPAKPTNNGYIESFNGKLRDECLNVNQFGSLADARQRLEQWRQDCNTVRPHRALGDLTPSECVTQRQEQRVDEASPHARRTVPPPLPARPAAPIRSGACRTARRPGQQFRQGRPCAASAGRGGEAAGILGPLHSRLDGGSRGERHGADADRIMRCRGCLGPDDFVESFDDDDQFFRGYLRERVGSRSAHRISPLSMRSMRPYPHRGPRP